MRSGLVSKAIHALSDSGALRSGFRKPLGGITNDFRSHVTWLLILRRRALPFAADEQVIQGGIQLECDGSLSFEILLPYLVVRDGRLVVASSLQDEQRAFQVLGRASRHITSQFQPVTRRGSERCPPWPFRIGWSRRRYRSRPSFPSASEAASGKDRPGRLTTARSLSALPPARPPAWLHRNAEARPRSLHATASPQNPSPPGFGPGPVPRPGSRLTRPERKMKRGAEQDGSFPVFCSWRWWRLEGWNSRVVAPGPPR